MSSLFDGVTAEYQLYAKKRFMEQSHFPIMRDSKKRNERLERDNTRYKDIIFMVKLTPAVIIIVN